MPRPVETRPLRLHSRPFLWAALGACGRRVAEVTGKERDESRVTVASFITGAQLLTHSPLSFIPLYVRSSILPRLFGCNGCRFPSKHSCLVSVDYRCCGVYSPLLGSTRRSNCGWFLDLGLGGIVGRQPRSKGEGLQPSFSHPASSP